MDLGAPTNTRTLDRALDDAVSRLSKLGTPNARRLIDTAEIYRAEIESWEQSKPAHAHQDKVIESIMQLLSEAMILTRHVSSPPPSDEPLQSEPSTTGHDEEEIPSRPGSAGHRQAGDPQRHVLGRLKRSDQGDK